MIITREWLEANSNGGSPNNRQLKLFGMRWPLRPGWREKLIGRDIDVGTAAAFVMQRKHRPQPDQARRTAAPPESPTRPLSRRGELSPSDFQRGKEMILSGLCACDLPPWEACTTCPDRIAA
jgi:hypothetical protein